jgi:hypothetical protein
MGSGIHSQQTLGIHLLTPILGLADSAEHLAVRETVQVHWYARYRAGVPWTGMHWCASGHGFFHLSSLPHQHGLLGCQTIGRG